MDEKIAFVGHIRSPSLLRPFDHTDGASGSLAWAERHVLGHSRESRASRKLIMNPVVWQQKSEISILDGSQMFADDLDRWKIARRVNISELRCHYHAELITCP